MVERVSNEASQPNTLNSGNPPLPVADLSMMKLSYRNSRCYAKHEEYEGRSVCRRVQA